MNAAIESADLKPDEEKVEALIEEMASAYQEPEQVREYYNSNPQQKAQVEALALEDQVVEKVLESAQVSEVESNYEEVVRLANQPA